jgi:hypothetical protein
MKSVMLCILEFRRLGSVCYVTDLVDILHVELQYVHVRIKKENPTDFSFQSQTLECDPSVIGRERLGYARRKNLLRRLGAAPSSRLGADDCTLRRLERSVSKFTLDLLLYCLSTSLIL